MAYALRGSAGLDLDARMLDLRTSANLVELFRTLDEVCVSLVMSSCGVARCCIARSDSASD